MPNQQSVDWPQAQLAPLYLPPGSPSFQPYRYGRRAVQPHLYTATTPALVVRKGWRPVSHPGGDIAQLPSGGLMSNLAGLFQGRSRSRRAWVVPQDNSKGWGWRKAPPTATPVSPPAVRMGPRPSHQQIPRGIPHAPSEFVPPAPIATAGLTNLYGGLALQNSGCIGCGDFGDAGWFTDEAGDWDPMKVGLGVLAGWTVLGLAGAVASPLSVLRLAAGSVGIALPNGRRRRRKKRGMSKAARSRAAKKGWRKRRRRGR